MQTISAPNREVVLIYIDLVRQDSAMAAVAIQQIDKTIGPQAALRAALIITIFRMELKQNHWIPDLNVYAYLIQDFPEALSLLEYAMGCCLQAWGVHDFTQINLRISNPIVRILERTR